MRKDRGDYGEGAAEGYLSAKGYAILARNYKRGRGEIDIIARDGDTTVFAEVKYRRGLGAGLPREAVTPAKRRHICNAALHYIAETGADGGFRFDVLEVFGRELLDINHIENAFDYEE